MTPTKVKKPLEHTDADEIDAMPVERPVERYLLLASMLCLALVVLTLMSPLGHEAGAANDADAGYGAPSASTAAGRASDAAKLDETKKKKEAGDAPAIYYPPDP